ncbi:putative purine nucleoside permease [Jackrogersella minutella]|nr:putative purine nucleoside permease [Jackrogersella minutella]
MLLPTIVSLLLLAKAKSMTATANAAAVGTSSHSNAPSLAERQDDDGKIAPKVVIISMFSPEAEVWYENLPNSVLSSILAQNITVWGLSPLYPDVHCTETGEVCQFTAGESEINAASSAMAFVMSGLFNLSETYFLFAGIAGVNPKLGTLGGVALSRFSVQVALQYEFDAREKPENFTTGYLPYGAYMPDQYPTTLYGTEVHEVNEDLRNLAADLAARATLNDSSGAADYRAKYSAAGDMYKPAMNSPSVIKCDSATSDVYFSGGLLGEAFENTTKIWTNQTDMTYCMSAQEDSAVLQVLLRSAVWKLVDFSRIILMRTGSDFDRPPPSISAFDHLRIMDQNGYDIAIANLYLSGVEIVKSIVADWNTTYRDGVKPTNYIGDIFGTLGGEPDFGPGSVFKGTGFSLESSAEGNLAKRSLTKRKGGNARGWK